MPENNKQEKSELLYPSIHQVISSENTKEEDGHIRYPIHYDPNKLCCPFCGNEKLNRAGKRRDKKGELRLQQYECRPCTSRFLAPKDRLGPPKPKRVGNRRKNKDAYFDPNKLCCPKCGCTKLRKAGKTKSKIAKPKKQIYKCTNKLCGRKFVDPALRQNGDSSSKANCTRCGGNNCIKRGFKNKRKRKQTYLCYDCDRIFIPDAKRKFYPKLKLSEDVWDGATLGLDTTKTCRKKLNFSYIVQPWLKELAKKYVKLKSVNRVLSTLQNYLHRFNILSEFIDNNFPELNAVENITRDIIVEYISYLNSLGNKWNTTSSNIGTINDFFSMVNKNNWGETAPYLILPQDYPKGNREINIRAIPHTVLKQLNNRKFFSSPTIETMISVFLETGLRYLTLATIPLNCLELDNNNKWWIKFKRVKIPEYGKLPISTELAEKIKKQQSFVKKYHNDNIYLFAPKSLGDTNSRYTPQKNKIILKESFSEYFDEIVRENNIVDDNGELYYITSHQFRHTFGTEAINNGVPQHIVQKMLGHKSPEMTMHYAHIHDETIIKELEKLHLNRTFDITGQIVELELEGDPESLEWFTKEINAIALPSGYCGRPRIEGDCDIAGDVGCYICPFFRTNKTFLAVHKDQLERINEVLAKAYKYDWKLPIKKNEPIKRNLELIIYTLEKDNNEQEQ